MRIDIKYVVYGTVRGMPLNALQLVVALRIGVNNLGSNLAAKTWDAPSYKFVGKEMSPIFLFPASLFLPTYYSIFFYKNYTV